MVAVVVSGFLAGFFVRVAHRSDEHKFDARRGDVEIYALFGSMIALC